MAVTWTEDRIDQLRALWKLGIPSHEIAARMGLSRGMISGKRYSLGLPPREGEVARAAEALNARRAAAIYRNVSDAALVRREVILRDELGRLEALIKPLDGSSPRPWEQRRHGECAFPVAGYGAGTLSCCEVVDEDPATHRLRPYCYAHSEILAGRPWPPQDPAELGLDQYAAA